MGKQNEKTRMETNTIDVSPSRFAILDVVDGDKMEDRPEQVGTNSLDEVEEGEIKNKETSNKTAREMREQIGVRHSLPRGSKSMIKNGSEASSQASKDKNPGAWKSKAPKKKKFRCQVSSRIFVASIKVQNTQLSEIG